MDAFSEMEKVAKAVGCGPIIVDAMQLKELLAALTTARAEAEADKAEIARLRAERDFLLARAGHAGSCSFAPGRWTGVSSNAIVTVAFGGNGDSRSLPYDNGDLAACYRTMMRLPKHLLSDKVWEQLEAGERYVAQSYNIATAKAAANWPENARAALGEQGQ